MLKRYEDAVVYCDDKGTVKATLTYRLKDDVLVIEQVFVDPLLRGRGIGQQLIEQIIAFAKEKHYRIRPVCSYAVAYFEKMPHNQCLLERSTNNK